MGRCLALRAEEGVGGHSHRLGRSRVYKNTVRQELNGAVLCTRLLVRTVRAMDTKSERIWIAGDSETVLISRLLHRML